MLIKRNGTVRRPRRDGVSRTGSEIDTKKGERRRSPRPASGRRRRSSSTGSSRSRRRSSITTLTLTEKLDCKKAKSSARRRGQEAEDAQALGRRQGQVPHQGQVQRRHRARHKWLVQDTCTSTLTRVTQGTVTVDDIVKKKKKISCARASRYTRGKKELDRNSGGARGFRQRLDRSPRTRAGRRRAAARRPRARRRSRSTRPPTAPATCTVVDLHAARRADRGERQRRAEDDVIVVPAGTYVAQPAALGAGGQRRPAHRDPRRGREHDVHRARRPAAVPPARVNGAAQVAISRPDAARRHASRAAPAATLDSRAART